MDAPIGGRKPRTAREVFLLTAFAPVLPQLVGSAFNIFYNREIIIPLLATKELKLRFVQTLVAYNAIVYPIAVYLWVRLIGSLRPPFDALSSGRQVPAQELDRVQRRVVHLPWWGALLSGLGWLGCIPVFLLSLATVGHALDPVLLWHFPISILISTLISTTHGIFFVEAISYRHLFPVFFRDSRALLASGQMALSLRWRGVLWAVSIGICPIASLLLLSFAPTPEGTHPQIFATIVAVAGAALGLFSAWLASSLVATPIDELQTAARHVAAGRLDHRISAARPDEFGQLLAAFDHMLEQLREKEKLRQTFGVHVGQAAAEQILTRDPGLGGVEQMVTVMFVDIRGFTARSASATAAAVVSELNEFLRVMVHVVEERNGGMINKFLGDGFMALFGVGGEDQHAQVALRTGRDILGTLRDLNGRIVAAGKEPLVVGIGIHTGPAVIGSIGSPQRLEFTAIGSAVNIAARIEQLTKTAGVPLLFTEETARCLPRNENLIAIEPQHVRGLDRPIVVYTISLPDGSMIAGQGA